jgi:hypothetical protein
MSEGRLWGGFPKISGRQTWATLDPFPAGLRDPPARFVWFGESISPSPAPCCLQNPLSPHKFRGFADADTLSLVQIMGTLDACPGSPAYCGPMKRRTLKRLRPGRPPEHHHSVYVGMTGLTPEERFANHKSGDKASLVVKRYGIRLLSELYAHLNPMPFEAAAQMEQDLANDLRGAGYTATGGH